MISVSIISCGGASDEGADIEPVDDNLDAIEDKEYPFNVQWVSDVSSGDIEIIMREEEKCEKIRGMANEVKSYHQWKSEMYGRCN